MQRITANHQHALKRLTTCQHVRRFCSPSSKKPRRRGHIVGCKVQEQQQQLTDGWQLLHDRFGRDVRQLVREAAYPLKAGQVLLQPGGLGHDADGWVNDICVVGISDDGEEEKLRCGSERPEPWQVADDLRAGVRAAALQLKRLGCRQLLLDSFGDSRSVAEAALAAVYSYRTHRGANAPAADDPGPVQVGRLECGQESREWEMGVALGGAEVRARDLMERPANKCSPAWFCAQAAEALAGVAGVTCQVMEEAELRQLGMGGLLAVARGSAEPPRLLVAAYEGRAAEAPDLCLVGKGVTFDSGGVSIKPAAKMADMRADMGGAAVAFSAFLAAAQLRLPLSLRLCAPLCENLPDGAALKPGDLVETMSGLTVRADNTDAEGRLLLADTLHYSCERLRAGAVIDVATLTGAVAVALGHSRAGLFANRAADGLAQRLLDCGFRRGDPLHRLPLDRSYRRLVHDASGIADLSNVGSADRLAGACTAAAFLSHFVPASVPWLHLDMAGVMQSPGGAMTGRPARALLQLLIDLAADQ